MSSGAFPMAVWGEAAGGDIFGTRGGIPEADESNPLAGFDMPQWAARFAPREGQATESEAFLGTQPVGNRRGRVTENDDEWDSAGSDEDDEEDDDDSSSWETASESDAAQPDVPEDERRAARPGTSWPMIPDTAHLRAAADGNGIANTPAAASSSRQDQWFEPFSVEPATLPPAPVNRMSAGSSIRIARPARPSPWGLPFDVDGGASSASPFISTTGSPHARMGGGRRRPGALQTPQEPSMPDESGSRGASERTPTVSHLQSQADHSFRRVAGALLLPSGERPRIARWAEREWWQMVTDHLTVHGGYAGLSDPRMPTVPAGLLIMSASVVSGEEKRGSSAGPQSDAGTRAEPLDPLLPSATTAVDVASLHVVRPKTVAAALASAAVGVGADSEVLMAFLKGLPGGGGVDVTAVCVKDAVSRLRMLAKQRC